MMVMVGTSAIRRDGKADEGEGGGEGSNEGKGEVEHHGQRGRDNRDITIVVLVFTGAYCPVNYSPSS